MVKCLEGDHFVRQHHFVKQFEVEIVGVAVMGCLIEQHLELGQQKELLGPLVLLQVDELIGGRTKPHREQVVALGDQLVVDDLVVLAGDAVLGVVAVRTENLEHQHQQHAQHPLQKHVTVVGRVHRHQRQVVVVQEVLSTREGVEAKRVVHRVRSEGGGGGGIWEW